MVKFIYNHTNSIGLVSDKNSFSLLDKKIEEMELFGIFVNSVNPRNGKQVIWVNENKNLLNFSIDDDNNKLTFDQKVPFDGLSTIQSCAMRNNTNDENGDLVIGVECGKAHLFSSSEKKTKRVFGKINFRNGGFTSKVICKQDLICLLSYDKILQVWDSNGEKCKYPSTFIGGHCMSAPEEGFLIHSCDKNDTVNKLDLITGAKVFEHKIGFHINTMEASKNFIFLSDETQFIKTLDTRSNTPINSIKLDSKCFVNHMHYHDDLLLITSSEGIKLFDLKMLTNNFTSEYDPIQLPKIAAFKAFLL